MNRTISKEIAFGFTSECNAKCSHCIMGKKFKNHRTMNLELARFLITELVREGVRVICFTGGESLLFPDDVNSLIKVASRDGCHTVLSTNAYWASSIKNSGIIITQLKNSGLSKLRISFSRWHQCFIDKENIIYAAKQCVNKGLAYGISFVTDFSKKDDDYAGFLVRYGLPYNREQLIYSGFAKHLKRTNVINEYSAYCCKMTPYISPDLDVFACCDAGKHFDVTGFFCVGNLLKDSLGNILKRIEYNILFKLIGTIGLRKMASEIGIDKLRCSNMMKCDLCELIFNSESNLNLLIKKYNFSETS